MTVQSNLYAERVFSEHPVSLWSLDDDVSYISLVPNSFRDVFSTWSVSNGISSEYEEDFPVSPFISNFTTEISNNYAVAQPHTVSCISSVSIQSIDLSSFHKNFCISGYFYSDSDNIESITIGYRIDSTSEKVTKQFSVFKNSWIFITNTFENPGGSVSITPIIEINYLSNSGSVLINGLSMGHWSENYSIFSLGTSEIQITDTALSNVYGVRASGYSPGFQSGYYISENSGLYAIDSGLPMCYGSRRSVTLFPKSNSPSIIFPAMNFLHDYGKKQSLTLEFWIRINSYSNTPERIVGPISSDDGLYVDGHSLVFKIGSSWKAHFIGNWGRPMLISMAYDSTRAYLIVNGEEVLSMDLDEDSMSFPSSPEDNWIGFYVTENIGSMDLDVVAIYPYRVPAIVAKRRFVYGQGVEFPSKIRGNVLENTVSVDFATANYSKNLSYPKNASWNQAIVDNLNISENSISSPTYSLPRFVFSDKSYEDLVNDSQEIQDSGSNFINLRPNEDWEDTTGYIVFDNSNFLNNDMAGFYGVFSIDNINESDQTLFYLENSITKEYLKIFLNDDVVKYAFNNDSNIVHSNPISEEASQFLAGIDLDSFGNLAGQEVYSFVSNKSQLVLYVGASADFSQKFTGNIYSINLCNRRNLSTLSNAIDADGAITKLISLDDPVGDGLDAGLFNTSSWALTLDSGAYDTDFWNDLYDGGSPFAGSITSIFNHVASYTLKPRYYLGTFDLEIKTNSYWEDYVPLTHLAKYVTDHSGDRIYALDFIQFNLDYPDSRSVVDGIYHTEKSELKSYVSFQRLSEGASSNAIFNLEPIPLGFERVVTPGNSWTNKKYEIINGTIVYPPSNANIEDIAVVIHLEFETEDSRRPIFLKSLGLSSLALDVNPSKIGTRYGNDLIPYSKFGPYFDYRSKNPFRIYKGSSPHLYLTSDSGVSVLGTPDSKISRGLSQVINKKKAADYKVSNIQMSIRQEQQEFSTSPVEIFEVQAADRLIKFYVRAYKNDTKRGVIFALDGETYLPAQGFSLLLNGRLTKNPIINPREWSMLSISFSSSLLMDGFAGAVRITGPMVINNITSYRLNQQDQANRFFYRLWGEVSSEFWSFWTASIWEDVLVLSDAGGFGVDPVYSYGEFTGTNRFVFDTNSELFTENYRYRYYSDLVWQSQTVPAL